MNKSSSQKLNPFFVFLTTDSLLDGVYGIALSVCVCVSLNTSHLPPAGQILFKLEETVLGFLDTT